MFNSIVFRSPSPSPEGYSSPQGDHSPSLLVPPSLPMSSCPLSSVPTSTQTKPHLLTPLSGRDQPQARLKLARECPQTTKPSNGSLSMGRTRLNQKQPSPLPSLSSTKQKRVSRRRATNGWRPVGVPTEREVFIAVGLFSECSEDEPEIIELVVVSLVRLCLLCSTTCSYSSRSVHAAAWQKEKTKKQHTSSWGEKIIVF